MLSFPRVFAREMRPLLRLLEHDTITPSSSSSSLFRSPLFSTSFYPSFDVKETKDSYVLDGELPGLIDKSNLDLQFVDPTTLVVKGRIERSSTSSSNSDSSSSSSGNSDYVSDEAKAKVKVADGAAVTADAAAEGKSYKATVEDGTPSSTLSATTSTTTATPADGTTDSDSANTKSTGGVVSRRMKANQEGHRFWVQERMVGEFQRNFTFPQNIDQEAVKASLKNGILSIIVPKKNAAEGARKIEIE